MSRDRARRGRNGLRRYLRDNGLSLALLGMFLVSLIGHLLTGQRTENLERFKRGQDLLSLGRYVASGAFVESVFENWESEFLQMALYVVLTVSLRQKGSAESKPPEGSQPVDADPRTADLRRRVPWPVRTGGWTLRLYENSLGIALGTLFAASLLAHAIGGARAESEKSGSDVTNILSATVAYLGSSRFWFESFQNWQSEFLSVAVLVVLSVYLRQRGSPQSKPVAAPHYETGD
ncbi:MAG TPA: DUF6766 family protein [Vicinamibacteria bacterium]